jgi:hypothetical protein
MPDQTSSGTGYGAQQVEASCGEFSTTLKKALEWVNDPANAARLEPQKRAIEQELRTTAFETSKLARTASRPMCIGVFGPSQSGKSYLLSVLARKDSKLMAEFDGPPGKVDFIAEINPKGGKEATGLVTRFTLEPVKTQANFPVALRLLNQTDLVKVIVNAFTNDSDLDLETPPSRDDVLAHVKSFENAVLSGYEDELREEHVWDLHDYVRKRALRIDGWIGAFWDRIAELAPRLPLNKRAELYSILWGKHEALTALYLKLASSLAKLGFAEDVYAQTDALLPSSNSILNVDTLSKIAVEDTSMLKLSTAKGAVAELPRSVVAALTAELRIRISERAWDFLDHTDLLDFPGYRSRDNKQDLKRLLATAREVTIEQMMLRGKVDYLFQRYTADQELTGMVLCIRDSNLEVKTLPNVIEDWITVTHGAMAESRVGKPTLLFFCLTMFDNHLVVRAGDDPGNPGEKFDARMEASLIKPFGSKPGTWPSNWTPGKPFDNCFWIRNPNVKAESTIEYDDWREVGIREDKIDWLKKLRDACCQVPVVREHFKDPARAFDEVMRLNDGGVSYLAESLAKVCLPEMKAEQLRNRLTDLRKKVAERLRPHYVPSDVEVRLREREEVCEQIFTSIEDCLSANRFGTFLAGLCIDRVPLGDAVYVARTSGANGEANKEEGSSSRRGLLTSLVRPSSRDSKTIKPRPRQSTNVPLADAAVQAWAAHMKQIAESEPFGRAVSIPTAIMGQVVAEISQAAQRQKISDKIASQLDRVLFIENNDAIVAKATLIAAHVLNSFITSLGYDKRPVEERPRAPDLSGGEGPIFAPKPAVHDPSAIGEKRSPFADSYAVNWSAAFHASLRDNALSVDGSVQDPVQNARLGEIIEQLKP